MCIVCSILCGCNGLNDQLDLALSLRQQLNGCNKVSFVADITAESGDEIFQFQIDCASDQSGAVVFSVISPESIAGITGKINADGGGLTFDNDVLPFPLVVEGVVAPVSGAWLLLNSLRSGYISSCGESENGLQLIINDSYNGENLDCLIWLNEENYPEYCEIVWQGQRTLSIQTKDFVIS